MPQSPSAVYCEPIDDVCTTTPSMHTYTDVLQKGGRPPASTAIDHSPQSEEPPALTQDQRVVLDDLPMTMAHVRVAHESRAMPSGDDMMDEAKPTGDDVTMLVAAQQHHYGTPLRFDTNDVETPFQDLYELGSLTKGLVPSSTATRLDNSAIAHDPEHGDAPAPPAKRDAFQPVSNRTHANTNVAAAIRNASIAEALAPLNMHMDREHGANHMTDVAQHPCTFCPKNGDTYGMRRPAIKSTRGKADKTSRERARRAKVRKATAAATRQLRVEQERQDEFEMQAMIEPECAICQLRIVTELLVNCGQVQEPGHRGHGACEVCAPLIVARGECHLCRGPVHRFVTMDASFF